MSVRGVKKNGSDTNKTSFSYMKIVLIELSVKESRECVCLSMKSLKFCLWINYILKKAAQESFTSMQKLRERS